MKPKIIFLVGPTAIGKSKIALNIAKKLNAEIISCDSMQIYRGMDILSAKPSFLARKRVKHHLISFLNPEKEYNVATYRKEALKLILDIVGRGKVPLFVGGTGFYMSVLVDGIFEKKIEDSKLRNKFYRQAKKFGPAYLYSRLEEVDPQAALKIHPHDTKRIVRALEVFSSTGKPISQWQKERKGLADEYRLKVFCLDMPREKLYQRINRRVDEMFRQGLLKEVKNLFKHKLSKTASCAIGIKELKGYLEGSYDLDEAKRQMMQNSRHYAKRQLTWFRKDKRIRWIKIRGRESIKEIAKRILDNL